jgi:3-hydroxy-9,10-secoandrosta-1,3,5(10)-triene-9,17-dione monooxygenase
MTLISPMDNTDTGIDGVLQTIEAGRSVLRADAQKSDRTGTVSSQTIELIRAAGGYRLAADQTIGIGSLVRLGETIARNHPAAAWNCIVSNTNALLAQQFAQRAGIELPTDPDVQWCGVFASAQATAARERGGGHTVSGRWPYASNSELAEWALLNVAHDELGPTFVLVKRRKLESLRDWAAIGLRATGSHTLTVNRLHVDESELLTSADLYHNDPSYRAALRVPSRLRTALGLTAVAVGAGEALLAELLAAVDSDSRAAPAAPGMPRRGVSSPGFGVAVGGASSRISGAKTVLFATADRLDQLLVTQPLLAPDTLTEVRLTISRVARDIADAAHEISLIAGTRACLESNSVGRAWRDVHIATRHAALSPLMGFDLGGRALVDPEASDAAAAAGPLAPSRA